MPNRKLESQNYEFSSLRAFRWAPLKKWRPRPSSLKTKDFVRFFLDFNRLQNSSATILLPIGLKSKESTPRAPKSSIYTICCAFWNSIFLQVSRSTENFYFAASIVRIRRFYLFSRPLFFALSFPISMSFFFFSFCNRSWSPFFHTLALLLSGPLQNPVGAKVMLKSKVTLKA